MKNIFLFLISALIAGQSMQAQKCACNPNGWDSFTVTLNNVAKTVNCGYQFSIQCKEKIELRGSYKCRGICITKYSAVLKNAAGAVVMNYPVFAWPWSYSFPAAGNYSLEITPICGDVKCPPCRFFFTVSCPVCECDTNGWQKFMAQIGTKPATAISCYYQFGVKKEEPFKLDGKFLCKGDCNAKHTARLLNNVTGAQIQKYPNFIFPWNYTFTTGGNFKLEIIPNCGDKRCQSCVFYFTVI